MGGIRSPDTHSHQTSRTGKTLGMLKPLLTVLPEHKGEEKNILDHGNVKDLSSTPLYQFSETRRKNT